MPSAPVEDAPNSGGDVTSTELGGLFYLLPLALHLGLYGDFTRPRIEPGVLDPWDFVTLLGRELGAHIDAGTEADPDTQDDPVWALLGMLAGRAPGNAPGGRWRSPRDWRIDPAWLKPLPGASSWAWSADGRRLRVTHPDGFAILETVSRARTAGGVRATLERAIPGLAEIPALLHVPASGRRRREARACWIAEVAAYVRPRLRLALGLPPGGNLAEALFRYPASVFVDAESVTVELSLEALPIEIRIAGLDRDLGWVPAARRSLAFRFI